MFERPIKGDLDRSLSLLTHEARHKVLEEANRIKADAIKVGAFQSNRVIVTVAKAADAIHQNAMEQAKPILLDFIERMQRPPAEITAWARPHLESLGNAVLGGIPPNGFAADHKRIRAQYAAVFQQRLNGVLRDVEIGFVKGAGFARAEQVESKEEWISAIAALTLLKPTLTTHSARMAICNRAHNGLISCRAQRLMIDTETRDDVEIPKEFWWAEGHKALEQDWELGDFATWTDLGRITGNPHLSAGKVQIKAFGVSLLRADIEKMIRTGPPSPAAAQAPAVPTATAGGRPPADWWDDLWIEICRQLYAGELIPKKQSDIEGAMKDWLATRGEHPSDSTLRPRARKL